MPGRKFQTIVSSLLLIFALLGASLPGDPQSARQPQSQTTKKEQKPSRISSHIVLITISGLRADAVNGPNRAQMPTIQSLREKGIHAVGVESVFPTQTNPAHASIITGTLPADHGITSDFPFDDQTATQAADPYRLAKEIKTEPIWEYVRREGFTVATAGFPLTVGANLLFNVHAAAQEESQSTTQLRGELLSTLKPGNYETPVGEKSKPVIQPADVFNTEAIVHLIGKHRPNLAMINFTSLDLAQQRFGIAS
ncbi:MAG: alkaline phosphatase family protein, partial [Blastocatellia bacterium]